MMKNPPAPARVFPPFPPLESKALKPCVLSANTRVVYRAREETDGAGPGVKGVKVGRTFQNRSFLYRFNVAMDPGVQAARWCLSQEMSKMQGRVKDVCAVVERHTVRGFWWCSPRVELGGGWRLS